MADTPICPVCNGPLEPGENVCSRCGFRLAGETRQFAPITSGDIAAAAANRAVSSKVEYSLYVVKGPQVGEEFFLTSHKLTIGRDPHCDIFLNDMTVSREHAIVTIDGNAITIQDDNSLNGTWVDGKIAENAQLKPGSLVQIGTFNMILRQHAPIE